MTKKEDRRRLSIVHRLNLCGEPSPKVKCLLPRFVQGNTSAKAASEPVTTEKIKDIGLQRMTVTGTDTPVATAGESFPAGDLWKDQPAIVFVVRRPGCALCREHGEVSYALVRSMFWPSRLHARVVNEALPSSAHDIPMCKSSRDLWAKIVAMCAAVTFFLNFQASRGQVVLHVHSCVFLS